MDFSPNSQSILAAGQGTYGVPSAVDVWKLAAGDSQRIGSPLVQLDTIQHAKFSTDTQFVVAGDRSGTVQLWDLEMGMPIIDPFLADGGFGVTRVGINPQMSRLFAVTGWGGQVHHRALPPRNMPVPDWFPPFVEAVAGQRATATGALESLTNEALREAKARVSQLSASSTEDDFYARWATWLLADHGTRAVAPFASVTVPEEVAELLTDGSLASLRRAHHIDPTNARVMAALARELASFQFLHTGPPLDAQFESTAEWLARLAVEKAPDSVEARWPQAEVFLRVNKPEAARAALAEAIRLEPDNPDVLAVQSEIAWRSGQDDEAHALMDRALNSSTPATMSAFLKPGSLASRPAFFDAASLRN